MRMASPDVEFGEASHCHVANVVVSRLNFPCPATTNISSSLAVYTLVLYKVQYIHHSVTSYSLNIWLKVLSDYYSNFAFNSCPWSPATAA